MLLGVMSLWSIQNPGKPRALLLVLGLDSLEYSNVTFIQMELGILFH